MTEMWIEDLSSMRRDYKAASLDEVSVAKDPLVQFQQWFQESVSAGITEPNAMTLSTVNKDGKPSSRVVLLKEFSTEGFVFFTNYESRKGMELRESPFACLNFFWAELERQIRIEGSVEKLDEERSDKYFLSRPEGSRLGAWVSPQSTKINSRKELEIKAKEVADRFADVSPTRPPFWGGFLIKPLSFEFWQGRPDRMHDRILFENIASKWAISRLAP